MRSFIKNSIALFLVMCGGWAHAQKTQPLPKANRFVLPPGVTVKDYLPGVIIVKFKPELNASAKVLAAATAIGKLKVPGATLLSVSKRFKSGNTATTATSVSRAADHSLDRIYEVKFSGQADIVTVINRLLQQGNLEYAEPDYVYNHFFAPNDPRYTASNQSYLDLVKAPQAWDLIRTASSVIIAIVDSGSDLTHEDLAANIYLNLADPINGLDDDKDGYVDNYRGWDFIGLSGSAIKEDNDPGVKSDTTEHGVHVSGIAGAVSNNGRGVASIAFDPKLLIVKCGADNNGDAIYRGYDGIKYAADHGAQVINCSWGGSGGGAFGQDIVNYAIARGSLIVAAAGNENSPDLNYPAAYAGVLAVASVSNTDVRSTFSNFGTHVGIAAPGNNILSTFVNNTYGNLSGTSMASPVVASAAALLKSYVPSLTMAQVGERLRATTDNIDAKNPNYVGLIGKGRLNMLRALTEFPPSVRYQKITLIDKANGSIPAGDTLTVYFDLKNFLAPVSSLNVQLSSAETDVTVTAADQTVSAVATGETKTLVGPFKVYVKPGTADNTPVQFKLSYSANGGSYTDVENFTITVSLDYFNVEVNKISTTFTSNGRVGYSLPNTTNGLGLVYNSENILFEAGLMIGRSEIRVSDNVRTGNGANEHFVKKVRAAKVLNSTAAFEARSEFDDSNNSLRIPVYVKHRQIAFSTAPDDKYTIAEYEVINQNAADLTGIYIGMFTDWDIDAGTNNITKFDAADRLAYVSTKAGSSIFGAVKLLSTTASPVYYPLSYMSPSDPLFDNIFTTAEKFSTLSNGIKAPGLGENTVNGYDVMFVSGYGPYTIPAGGSVKVAFAFIGGDNLGDIKASALAAQAKYDLINPAEKAEKFTLYQNYPNPVPDLTNIRFAIPKAGKVVLSLYDLNGKKVRTYLDETMPAGLHSFNVNSTGLANGIYIYQVRYNNEKQSMKMFVAR